ncbi:MAG: MarR family transcriptional regulator [Candidatus Nanohalobium sp.]
MLYRIKDGTTQKELVEELDRSKSTVSVHLKTLREDGLIREESEGHSKKIYLQKDALSAVERYASDLVDKVSDGFIEMWD